MTFGTSRMLKNVLRSDQVLMSCSTLFSSLSGAMIISKITPWIITLHAECPIYGIALSVAMLSVTTFFGVALIVIMLGDVMTSVVALLIRARECTKKR